MPIAEFPFPGPRRLPQGLKPPHPASGRAPTLEEILLEAATLSPPHPSIMTPEQQGAVENAVNHPMRGRIPPDVLSDPAALMALLGGASGQMPELGNNVFNEILKALIQKLDIEGSVYPTAARAISSDVSTPSITDLLTSRENPRAFSAAFGPEPGANPAQGLGQVEQMLARLQTLNPSALGAEGDAVESLMAESGLQAGPKMTDAIQARQPAQAQPTRQFQQLLERLREALQLAQQGPNPMATPQLDQFLARSGLEDNTVINALLDAIRAAGTGAQGSAEGLDPAALRSLAPAFNPGALRGALKGGGEGADAELLMRLMGMSRTRPQGGV